MSTLFRRSGFIGTVLLLFATLSPAVIAQTNVDGIVTADNQFEAYLGTVVTTQGSTSLGSSILWTSPVTLSTTMLDAGQTNYIQIVARNVAGGGSNPAMLIGEINLDDTDWEFANGTQQLLTNATDWTASATGFGVSPVTLEDIGPRGTSPWTNSNLDVIDAAAQHIWPLGEQANLNDFYFWAAIIPVEADMQVTKTDNAITATAGQDTLTYIITATNAGPAPITAGTLDDTLPFSCDFVAEQTGGASGFTASDTGVASLAETGLDMPVGSTITYTVDCGVLPQDQAAGNLSNTATVGFTDAGLTDPTPGNDSATDDTLIVRVSDLSLIKGDDELIAIAGTNLTYLFSVNNAGPSEAAAVTVVDTLPAGTSLVSDTSSFGCTEAPAGTVTCLVGQVAAGGSPAFNMVVAVDPSVPDSILNNLAEVSSDSDDPNELNNIDGEATDVETLADLRIVKTADPAGQVAQGEQLTYTFVVDNDGPSDAQNVQTIDDLPLDFVGQIASMPAECSVLVNVVTCNWGTLPAGFNTSYDIVINVPAAGALGTQVNSVGIVSSTADPDGGNSDSAATVAVVVAAAAEDTAVIAVQKFFRDGNDETLVTLTLNCASGSYAPASVTVDPDDFSPGSAFEHIFVVEQIPVGAPNPCTVVEVPVAGYDATYICGQDGSTSTVDDTLCNGFADFSSGTTACGWLDVQASDSNLCGIFNDPSPVDVDVTKVWETFGAEQADVDPDVRLTLHCEPALGIVGGTNLYKGHWTATTYLRDGDGDYDDEDGDYIGEGTATFEVVPWWFPTASDPDDQDYTECWVEENASNNDLVEVDNGCGDSSSSAAIEVAVGMGDECTITNTVFFEGIPTLNQYGMAILALLMLGVGFVGMRRFV